VEATLSVRGPPATGRFRQKSTVDGRLREKSTADGRLREKSTVNGRLSEKKGIRRRRGKEEKKKRGEEERIPSARASSSPAHRRRRRVASARTPSSLACCRCLPVARAHVPSLPAGRRRFFSRAGRKFEATTEMNSTHRYGLLKLRLYGSKSVVKYPRCSLRQHSTYSDAEMLRDAIFWIVHFLRFAVLIDIARIGWYVLVSMYRSPNRAIRGLPATLRYRRLGQFSSRYHPKWTGNDRFRSSVTDFGRYQKKREKIKKNVEFGATLPIQIHCP
ncbi:hypothetical protein BHM03_00042745, partial [Ensete ventricosum]